MNAILTWNIDAGRNATGFDQFAGFANVDEQNLRMIGQIANLFVGGLGNRRRWRLRGGGGQRGGG